MTKHEVKIAFDEYASLKELDITDQNICLEAVKAMDNSHSPYSKFRVGAALQLQSDKVLYGSNQENAAYPSGLCAERVALFHWGANHLDDPIVNLAITAHTNDFEILKPITPCGSCLQVMAEYEKKQGKPIRILLYCIDGPIWVINGIENLLPFLFFEERLA